MKLKQALESLDIDMELDDGDILTDVVVIAKVSRLDGPTTVGTDGITKLGLVTAANRIISGDWEPYGSEEDL